MHYKDQLLLASELGRCAFRAGKCCSPVKDKDFKAFLLACGDRRVGDAPAGEAPTLTLLDAWISGWREEANTAASREHADERHQISMHHPASQGQPTHQDGVSS